MLVLVGTMVVLYRYENLWYFIKNNTKQITSSIWELTGWFTVFVLNVITGQGNFYQYNIDVIDLNSIDIQYRNSDSDHIPNVDPLSDRTVVLGCRCYWQCLHQYFDFVSNSAQVEANNQFT